VDWDLTIWGHSRQTPIVKSEPMIPLNTRATWTPANSVIAPESNSPKGNPPTASCLSPIIRPLMFEGVRLRIIVEIMITQIDVPIPAEKNIGRLTEVLGARLTRAADTCHIKELQTISTPPLIRIKPELRLMEPIAAP
ncbi:uncharacterized protein METZ01_LOCUS133288, partial [marine metagenome]